MHSKDPNKGLEYLKEKFGEDSKIYNTAQSLENIFTPKMPLRAKQQELLAVIRNSEDNDVLDILKEVAKINPQVNKNLKDMLGLTTANLQRELQKFEINPQDIKFIFDDYTKGTKAAYEEANEKILSKIYDDNYKVVLDSKEFDKFYEEQLKYYEIPSAYKNTLLSIKHKVYNPQGVTYKDLEATRKSLNNLYSEDKTLDGYLKNFISDHLREDINKGINNIFSQNKEAYEQAKTLYETKLADYAQLKEIQDSTIYKKIQNVDNSLEDIAKAILKNAKGAGKVREAENPQATQASKTTQTAESSKTGTTDKTLLNNFNELTKGLTEQNRQSLELNLLDKIFESSLVENGGTKVLDSPSFLKALEENKQIFKSKGAKEYIETIQGFHKLFKRDADILSSLPNPNPKENTSNIATNFDGPIKHMLVDGVFGRIYRNFTHDGILFGIFFPTIGQGIQKAALKYHLGKALKESSSLENFNFNITQRANRGGFNSPTKELVERIVEQVSEAKEEALRVAKEGERKDSNIKLDTDIIPQSIDKANRFTEPFSNELFNALPKEIQAQYQSLQKQASEFNLKFQQAKDFDTKMAYRKQYNDTLDEIYNFEQMYPMRTPQSPTNLLDKALKEKQEGIIKEQQLQQQAKQEQTKRTSLLKEQRQAIQEAKDSNVGKSVNEVELLLSDSIPYTPLRQTSINLEDKTYNAKYVIIKKQDLKPNFSNTGTQGRLIKQTRVIQDIQNNLNANKLFFSEGSFDGLPVILQDGSVSVGNHRAEALKNLSKESLQTYKEEAKKAFNVDLRDDEVIVRMLDFDIPKQEVLNLSFASNVGREQNIAEKALSTLGKYQEGISKLPKTITASSVEEMQSIVSKTLDTTNNGLNTFDTNLALFTYLAKTRNKSILESLESLKGSAEEKQATLRMFVENAGNFYNISQQTLMPKLDLRDYLAQALYFTIKASPSRRDNFREVITQIQDLLKTTNTQGKNAFIEQNPYYYEDLIGKILGYSLARFKELENPAKNLFEFLNNLETALREELEPTLFSSGRAISTADIYDFLSMNIKSGIPSKETSELLELLPKLKEKQEAFNAERETPLTEITFTDTKGKEHILTTQTQNQWLETFNLKSLEDSYTPQHSDEIKEALGGKEIKLQKGSLLKLVSQGREEFIPQIKQVLDEPEAIIKDQAGDFLLIKHLKDEDYFVNVSFDNGEYLVSISNGIKESNNLTNKLNAGGEIVYQSPNASSILQTLLQASRYSTNKIDEAIIPQSQTLQGLESAIKEAQTKEPYKPKIKPILESLAQQWKDKELITLNWREKVKGKWVKRTTNFKGEESLRKTYEKYLQYQEQGNDISQEISLLQKAINAINAEHNQAKLSKETIEAEVKKIQEQKESFIAKENGLDIFIELPHQRLKLYSNKYGTDSKYLQNRLQRGYYKEDVLGEIKQVRESIQKDFNLSPIAEFGINYAEYYRDGKRAINKILAEAKDYEVRKAAGNLTQEEIEQGGYKGQVAGAFFREDLKELSGNGEIDLVWGEVTNPQTHKGYGLAHIIDKHPNFDINLIPEIVERGNLVDLQNGKVRIITDKYTIGMKKEWKDKPTNAYILTAFENNKESAKNLHSSTLTKGETLPLNSNTIIPQSPTNESLLDKSLKEKQQETIKDQELTTGINPIDNIQTPTLKEEFATANTSQKISIIERELLKENEALTKEYRELNEIIKNKDYTSFEISEATNFIKTNTKSLGEKYIELVNPFDSRDLILIQRGTPKEEAEHFLEWKIRNESLIPISKTIHNNKKQIIRLKNDLEFSSWSEANKARLQKNLARLEKHLLKQEEEYFKSLSLTYDLNTQEGLEKTKDLFYRANPTQEQIQLFKSILPIAKKLGVEVRNAIREPYQRGGNTKHIAGIYLLNANSARVKHSIKEKEKSKTLLHELIHSVTSRAMIAYERGATHLLNKEQIQAIENINSLYQQVFKQSDELGLSLQDDYGLTNPHELLAELSNPSFVEKLKKINVFEKLIDNIIQLFVSIKEIAGLKKTNAYDTLKNNVADIIQNYKSDFTQQYNNLKIRNITLNNKDTIQTKPFAYHTQTPKGIASLRASLKEALSPYINKEIINKQTGLKGKVSPSEINKISSKKAVHKSVENGFSRDEHFKVSENLKELFENAYLKQTHTDYKERPNIQAVHRFNTPLSINDKEAVAKITLFEKKVGNNRIYTLELEELNKPDSLASASNSIESAVKAQSMGDIAHEAPTIAKTDEAIIPQLQQKFKYDATKAKDLLDWHKDSSPLTKDEQGLPKVFYHGSRADKMFEVFDIDAQQKQIAQAWNYKFNKKDDNYNPAIGFWFSDNEKAAKSYGESHLYKVFLNSKKPFIMGDVDKNKWKEILEIFPFIEKRIENGELKKYGINTTEDLFNTYKKELLTPYRKALKEVQDLGYKEPKVYYNGDEQVLVRDKNGKTIDIYKKLSKESQHSLTKLHKAQYHSETELLFKALQTRFDDISFSRNWVYPNRGIPHYSNYLKAKGYDAIKFASDEFVVFNPNQIKAVENKGSIFDKTSGDFKTATTKDTTKEGFQYFNEQSPNIYHSNPHLGSGLVGGSVAGFESDESGNITFNPANFFLGLVGGAIGSKGVAQGFKAIKNNPELKEKLTKELASTLSKGWESATQKYPILSTLEPRYIVKNEKGREIQAKGVLKELENKEVKGLYNVAYNGKNATRVFKDLEAVEEAILFTQGNRYKGAKHIRIKHLSDENKEGYVKPLEIANLGKDLRAFLKDYEPFEEVQKSGQKANIYEWENKEGVRFRLVVNDIADMDSNPTTATQEIITFYSDRNLKNKMEFKNYWVSDYLNKKHAQEIIDAIELPTYEPLTLPYSQEQIDLALQKYHRAVESEKDKLKELPLLSWSEAKNLLKEDKSLYEKYKTYNQGKEDAYGLHLMAGKLRQDRNANAQAHNAKIAAEYTKIEQKYSHLYDEYLAMLKENQSILEQLNIQQEKKEIALALQRYDVLTNITSMLEKGYTKKEINYLINKAINKPSELAYNILRNYDTPPIGRGYNGYSMSNNAIAAYANGIKPISKWNAQDAKEFGEIIGVKVKLKDLKEFLLAYGEKGYHHTSSYYNETKFYSLAEAMQYKENLVRYFPYAILE